MAGFGGILAQERRHAACTWGRHMGAVLAVFPLRVGGELIMFVRHTDDRWLLLSRDTGKLERRLVPANYARQMIAAYGSDATAAHSSLAAGL
jgi:hypothetical protein